MILVLTPLYLRKSSAVWTFCSMWNRIFPRSRGWKQNTTIIMTAEELVDFLWFFGFIIARQRSYGKVMFSQLCVCLSTETHPHNPPPTPPHIRHGTPWSLTSDIWWPSLETCSNLFTWPPSSHPNWYWHLVAEVCMLGKRGVLECFLVNTIFILHCLLFKSVPERGTDAHILHLFEILN